MKASLLFVIAASMIVGTALNAQTNPTPPRPPAASTQPAPGPSQQRFILNGVWRESPQHGPIVQFRFEQNGEQFKAFSGGQQASHSDVLEFVGRYDGGVIVGKSLVSRAAPGHPAKWIDETIVVDDPDHVHIQELLHMRRFTGLTSSDAICDLQNSSHTQADYAFSRTVYADTHHEPQAIANCWAQVSAMQGNARAQAGTAMMFRDGEGIPRNPALAFFWAQKSAAQGDMYGENVLAGLYRNGIGTPKNLQLAQAWQSKVDAQTAPQRQVAQNNSQAQKELQQAIQGMIWGGILNGMLGSNDGGSSSHLPNPDDYQNQDDRHTVRDFADACRAAGGHIQGEMLGNSSCVPGVW